MLGIKELVSRVREGRTTLVVNGKFSHNPGGQFSYLLSDDGQSERDKLTEEALFAQIEPELRRLPGRTIKIGDYDYHEELLATPAVADGSGRPVEILADSPFFSDRSLTQLQKGPDVAQEAQAKGAAIFAKLLEDLDVLVSYSDSRFGCALQVLAREYLPLEANRHLASERVNEADLNEDLYSSPALQTATLRYLTCYSADNGGALAAFKTVLVELKNGGRAYTDDQIVQLCQALATLKRSLETGEPCMTLARLSQSALTWVRDYGLAPQELRFQGKLVNDPLSKQAVPEVGESHFSAYYRSFRRASDAIQRFVRTSELHSYVICFLAAKYGRHAYGQWERPAERIYEWGVRDQALRLPAETLEQMRENREEIRQAEADPAILNDLQQKIAAQGKAADKLRSNLERARQANKQTLREAIEPDLRFDRPKLQDWLVDLYTTMAQNSGGALGELLGELAAFNKAHTDLYRTILIERPKPEQEAAGVDFYAEKLVSRIDPVKGAEQRRVVDTAIAAARARAEVASAPASSPVVRNAVKIEFLRALARASESKLAAGFAERLGKINEDTALYEAQYRELRLGQRVASVAPTVGLPVVTVVDLPAGQMVGKNEKTVAARNTAMTKAVLAGRAGAVPASVRSPRPHDLKAETEYPIKVNGQTVAKAAATQDTVEVKPVPGVDPAMVASEGARIHDPHSGQPVFNVTVIQSLPQVGAFAPPGDRPKADKLLESPDEVGKMQDKFLMVYADATRTDPLTKMHRRQLLAEMFGENVLAAPEKSTALGIPTLGQGLGLVMAMVEHVGNVGNKALASREPDPETDETLPNLNWSRFFPVTDANHTAELTALLTYHYDRCINLQQIDRYIGELSELRGLVAALGGTGTRLVVVNDRLIDHVRPDTHADFVCHKFMPAALVLTGQSVKTEGEAATAVLALAKKIASSTLSPEPSVVPIVFASLAGLDPDRVPLPLITKHAPVAMPEVSAGQPGVWRDSPTLLAEQAPLTNPLLLAAVGLTAGEAARLGGVPKKLNMTEDDAIKALSKHVSSEERAAAILKIIKDEVRWELTGKVRTPWEQLGACIEYEKPLAAVCAEVWQLAEENRFARILARAQLVNLVLLQRHLVKGGPVSGNCERALATGLNDPELLAAIFRVPSWNATGYSAQVLRSTGAWATPGNAVAPPVPIDCDMKLLTATPAHRIDAGAPTWCRLIKVVLVEAGV